MERGPRVYKLTPLDRRRTDNQGKIPADFDYAKALSRIASGELMSTIARELSVTPQALSARLKAHPEYATAKESCHEARLDEAEEWGEQATDALELARARDVWKARSWRASVEVAHRWGPKQEITVTVPEVVLSFGARRPQRQVNDAAHLLQRNVTDDAE